MSTPRSPITSIIERKLIGPLRREKPSRKPCANKLPRKYVRNSESGQVMEQPVKFYTDEHVGRAVVRGLRQRGVDVLTVPEAGLLGATDEEHLERVRVEGRSIFTRDDDFLKLHAAGHDHAGIAFAPRDMSVGDVIRGLMLIYQLLDADDMPGHVEFFKGASPRIPRPCAKLRLRFPFFAGISPPSAADLLVRAIALTARLPQTAW